MSESHDDIPVDEVKRKDGSKSKKDKKEKKDKGYMIFEEEDSAEELFESVQKTQIKSKKAKPFKFVKKEKKERSEKKKQDEKEKKLSKESKKEEKTKWKKKILSKSGECVVVTEPEEQKTVFGVPLALAVERNPSHDGILLPAVVRECIDYISEYGLACEGIYRVSGVKSKVTQLKESYNAGATVYLVDHEPNVVASLLKLFLRELPEPVLTTRLAPKFEQASATKNVKQQVEQFNHLIQDLPAANRILLSWVIVHMTHVIEKEKFNKMSLQNVSIVLSPTMRISHRVLNVLFCYSSIFFRNTIIKKYVPPLKPATSRWALDLPECPGVIEEELKKQESLLNHMHEELMRVKDHRKEEELWEVQRVVTQLKRKLKNLRQMEQALTKADVSLDKKQSFSSQKSWSHIQHGHHESKVSLESSNADLAKIHDKMDRISLCGGEQARAESGGVKMRSKDHLRSSEKKHHTPEAHSRKKMLHGEGFTKRHSSSASERSSRFDKVDGMHRISLDKNKSLNRTSLDKTENSRRASLSKDAGDLSEGKQESDACREEIVDPNNLEDEQTCNNKSEIDEPPLKITEEFKVEGDNEITNLYEEKESIDTDKQTDKKIDQQTDQQTDEQTDEAAPQEESVSTDDFKITLKPDTERDQGTSVDRRLSEEMETAEIQSMINEMVETVGISQPISYEPTDDNASDSSDPYTDVAEEEDDDDDSDKKSRKRGDGDDNDYEVLGEEESPSPKHSGRPMLTCRSVDGTMQDDQDSTFAMTTDESSDEDDDFGDQAEVFENLLEEYSYVMMEEEELLGDGDELRQKIETERNEIERLQQDISELQMMRHDDDAFETSSSSSSISSDSSGSLDEDLTTDELRDMLLKHQQENSKMERDNADLCEKIHQERMACLEVKVQNRMIQQKQLDSNVDLIDFE